MRQLALALKDIFSKQNNKLLNQSFVIFVRLLQQTSYRRAEAKISKVTNCIKKMIVHRRKWAVWRLQYRTLLSLRLSFNIKTG